LAEPRLLSYSEIETAMSCWARHAFAYTGHLTGGRALRARTVPRVLSEGRALGAAAARWHERGNTLLAALDAAEALRASLDHDEEEMRSAGIELDLAERVSIEEHLTELLAHYIATAEPLHTLTRIEDEVIVGIPSRTGVHASTRYRFQCRIDGWTLDQRGPWLVEFKLRSRLQSAQLISTSRQLRWYAWALRQATGVEPVGVIVEEIWNVIPAPARIVQAKRKGEGIDGLTVSHAVNQQTTPESYLAACEFYGVEPNGSTLEHLQGIRWHQRTPLIFRDGEISEAGRELVSAAKLIRDLDSGALHPIRHVSAMTCNGCRFNQICPAPEDELFVETQFEYTLPKRLRHEETVA
jgi:hypothetical protein